MHTELLLCHTCLGLKRLQDTGQHSSYDERTIPEHLTFLNNVGHFLCTQKLILSILDCCPNFSEEWSWNQNGLLSKGKELKIFFVINTVFKQSHIFSSFFYVRNGTYVVSVPSYPRWPLYCTYSQLYLMRDSLQVLSRISLRSGFLF